jgi:quercetin dioxygenase-like cupin family protein
MATYIPDLGSLIDVNADATVSRTALKAEGTRIVLFSFDTGQELTEHTAAIPVLLHLIDGALEVTADGQTMDLRPGGVIHLPARQPHSVLATQPSRMVLTMLDPRTREQSGDVPAG